MTIHTFRVRRSRIAEETTFATDLTGTLASFIALQHTQMMVSCEQPIAETSLMQQKMDGMSTGVATGYKRATATFTCNLAALTARADNGTAATQTALGRLLRAYFGGQRLGTGDLVAAGSDTDTINVDTASRWENGCGIAYLADGRMRARVVHSKATAALTVYPTIPAADVPADNATAYNSATYYLGPSAQDDSGNKTIQLIAEGLVTSDRYLLLGGKVTSLSFTFARGQIATVQGTIQFVDWMYGEDCATDLTTDTAPLDYVTEASNGLAVTVHDSDLWITEVDASDGSLDDMGSQHASEITIGCSAQWVMVPSTSGVNGAIGWARNQAPSVVNVSMSVPYEDRTWQDARDDISPDEHYAITLQVGSTTAAGCVLFDAKVQIRTVEAPVDVEGLTYQRVSFVGGVPITADTTDIADSPFKIHLF